MAAAFVYDFSSKVEGKLDFSLKSLSLADKIIEDFKSTEPKELEIFIAECGSYVGLVLENYTRAGGKWHCSWPKYFFSGFRLPFRLKTKDGEAKNVIIETHPYAAVARRVLEVLGRGVSGEPEMSKYVPWLIGGMRKAGENK